MSVGMESGGGAAFAAGALDPVGVTYSSGVIAILRAKDARLFGDISRVLSDAGVVSIEFTMTSGGALAALAELARQLPEGVVLGAGTVLDAATADAVIDAGASYVVSPGVCLDVIERAKARGVPVFPRAATPTEVLQAWRAGATAVKIFPAATYGPEYLKHLHGPLPDVPLIPTGGIDIQAAGSYIRAGAVAVGIGGPLIGDAASGGDLGALGERARRLVAAVAEARRQSG